MSKSQINLKHFDILFNLLLLGANKKHISITTKQLAKKLNKSQQAISQYLLTLEKDGMIEKIYEKKGLSIKISQKGIDLLMTVYLLLRNVAEESPNIITVRGTVFTGLSEGAYYMSLPGYLTQFEKKLGFTPYAGTLNIKINQQYRLEREMLDSSKAIKIEGFKNGLRSYGGLLCFHAMIEGIRGAMIAIERTHYDWNVMEFIAPVKLRDPLKLTDGDEIEAKIFV